MVSTSHFSNNNFSVNQAGNLQVASRRQKRRVARTARQNGATTGNETSQDTSVSQAALDPNASANAKTRIMNGEMQYRSGNGWSKFNHVAQSIF